MDKTLLMMEHLGIALMVMMRIVAIQLHQRVKTMVLQLTILIRLVWMTLPQIQLGLLYKPLRILNELPGVIVGRANA